MCACTHDGWGRAEVGSLHLSGIQGSNSWVSLAEQGLLQAEPSLRPQDVFKPVFPQWRLHENKQGRGETRSGRTAEDNSFTSFQTRPFRTNFIWNGLFCDLKQKVLILRTKIVMHMCHTHGLGESRRNESPFNVKPHPASGQGSESWTESFAGEELLKYNPQTQLQNNIADLQQTRRLGNASASTFQRLLWMYAVKVRKLAGFKGGAHL